MHRLLGSHVTNERREPDILHDEGIGAKGEHLMERVDDVGEFALED